MFNKSDHNEIDTDALNSLLSDPALWHQPDSSLEDSIVAMIAAEPRPAQPPLQESNVTSISAAKGKEPKPRLFAAPLLAGLAAASLVLAGFGAASWLSSQPEGTELVLAGTDLAPDAEATAFIDEGPLGVEITLEIDQLPPAPEGHYYQAWVRKSPEIGISIGTFHMDGGKGRIILWAGVSTDDYPLVTVTIQEEGAGEASSGVVVLKGQLDS